LIAYLLLATSLPLVLAHGTLIEQELNGRVIPKIWSANLDANRPMSNCASSGSASATSFMQRGLRTSSVTEHHRGAGRCPFNFSLSLSQRSLTQVQGSSSLVQVSVTLVSGTSASVAISAQGAPAAAEILFAPASGKPSFSSAMTIATSAGTPVGQYNITVLATGGGINKSAPLSLLVVPIVHDIAIVAASVQGTATVGSIVTINATVANYGSVSEAFELRAYANASLVATQSGLRLAPAATHMDRLIWNTTGYSPGIYTIVVTVPPVQGQVNTLDNSREAGQILLTHTSGPGPSPSPSPSPAASGGSGQGFAYGRQLAILAAIAEAAMVFLVFLLVRSKAPTRNASGGPRKS
jgi:hypothetical protein